MGNTEGDEGRDGGQNSQSPDAHSVPPSKKVEEEEEEEGEEEKKAPISKTETKKEAKKASVPPVKPNVGPVALPRIGHPETKAAPPPEKKVVPTPKVETPANRDKEKGKEEKKKDIRDDNEVKPDRATVNAPPAGDAATPSPLPAKSNPPEEVKKTTNPPEEVRKNRVYEKLKDASLAPQKPTVDKKLAIQNQAKIWAASHFSKNRLSYMPAERKPDDSRDREGEKLGDMYGSEPIRERGAKNYRFPVAVPQSDEYGEPLNESRFRAIGAEIINKPHISDKVLFEATQQECLGFDKRSFQQGPLIKLNFPPPPEHTRSPPRKSKLPADEPSIFQPYTSDPPPILQPAKNPLSSFLQSINKNSRHNRSVMLDEPDGRNATPYHYSRGQEHKMSPYAPYVLQKFIGSSTNPRSNSQIRGAGEDRPSVIRQTVNATINIGEFKEYPYTNSRAGPSGKY